MLLLQRLLIVKCRASNHIKYLYGSESGSAKFIFSVSVPVQVYCFKKVAVQVRLGFIKVKFWRCEFGLSSSFKGRVRIRFGSDSKITMI